MVLYMSYQRRLHSKSTLGNGIADQAPARKVAAAHRLLNTDQGSQFTGSAWITMLTDAGVRISMDGRGRYLDNIFIERLWRSLKQEAIYLEEITASFRARRVIKDWSAFYNTERPHSALGGKPPAVTYWQRNGSNTTRSAGAESGLIYPGNCPTNGE